MNRIAIAAVLCALASTAAAPASADGKPRASVVRVDLGAGVPEFVRKSATAKMDDGLIAAGYDVVAADKLTPQLAACNDGACLRDVAKALGAPALVFASITRKDDSTIIVMRLVDGERGGDALAEVHEVCDLCGQSELEDRIGVAASALRAKAEQARTHGTTVASAPTMPAGAGGHVRVAVVPGITVNLDAARVDALGQDMAEALSTELDVEAVGGLEVRRALPADLPADCVTTPACVQDVAKRTGAAQILFVVMVDSGAGGSIQIDTTWVDPATGRSAQRPAIDIVNASDAKGRFAAVARQLLPDAPLHVTKTVGGGGPIVGPTGDGHHFTALSIAFGAAGVVGLAVGAGFGLDTRSSYNTCDGSPSSCTQSTRDSIRTTGLVADLGWIVGIGGIATAAAMYLTSGHDGVLVTPTEGGAAVSFSGRF
jgi:hypothetical protein|nr:hypothetical protein [Kofleriaceae bacterium]